MTTPEYEQYTFPSRRVIFGTYSGPRSGVGEGTKPLYAWVGTYLKDRLGDVTLCYAQRATPESLGDPDAPVDLECHLEIDDYIRSSTKLPEGLAIKTLPPETLLIGTYRGPLTGMRAVMLPWVDAMAGRFKVKPGYRQRIAAQGKTPEDTGWEVELQLVLGGR